MFNGVEIIIGGLGALIGIGGGYLALSAFFAGIRHIAKPNAVEVEEASTEKITLSVLTLRRNGLTIEVFCVIISLSV